MLKIKLVFFLAVAVIAMYLDSQWMLAHGAALSVIGLSVGLSVIEITKHFAKQKQKEKYSVPHQEPRRFYTTMDSPTGRNHP